MSRSDHHTGEGIAAPRQLDPAVLEEIVRRVVEVAQPDRIILFGSAARDAMDGHSDVDLLVVKSGDYRKRALAKRIYVALGGVGEAVDVVLVTPEEVERYRDSHGLVIKPALRDGRVVYAA